MGMRVRDMASFFTGVWFTWSSGAGRARKDSGAALMSFTGGQHRR
jgi:hypothetical protein